MNEEYVQRVARLVERLAPVVAERDLRVRRVGADLVVLRLDLRFLDGRRFEGNEIWMAGGRKYRFHLQDATGGLIWSSTTRRTTTKSQLIPITSIRRQGL